MAVRNGEINTRLDQPFLRLDWVIRNMLAVGCWFISIDTMTNGTLAFQVDVLN